MTDLPFNFSDGQELPASALNQMLTSRTGDIKPIDNTTREYTDNAGALGSATYRYTEAHIDNIKIDGNTISTTDADGDLTLQPEDDGDINLTTDAGRTKVSRLITGYGSQTTISRTSTGTTASDNILATRDIQVTGYMKVNSSAGNAHSILTCYSDSSSTPSTIIQIQTIYTIGTSDDVNFISFSFIVKKGDYYRLSQNMISGTGTLSNITYWREADIGVV